jgi:ABC-2 type transport system ATP-binding protein
MSTHQMHLVEELCDRILLINKGRDVLYGNLDEIRRRFSGHAVLVRAVGDLPDLRGVKDIQPHNHAVKLSLDERTTPQDVFKALAASNTILERFEIAIPSLDEIFIRVVDGGEVQ